MAFDGIVIANLTRDLKSKLEGGKINKIAQPEKDELLYRPIKPAHSLLLIFVCCCENISVLGEF